MKSSLFIWIIFFGGLFHSFAQIVEGNQNQTYAVVVGISDYQNEDIPDLRFADKDAAAFVAYLKSPAGGSLTDEHIKMLLNEKATTAQIAAALEWLVEVSGEGDRAIIYFSGHGDVETKTMFQLGYLLTWDSPARTYVAGAFPLQYLQAVVSTLSLQNKAEVALITDACRAGKLAGNNVGGAQITNANLSKQFANEVKILSCQPDEFSLEGEQWGGGRGVFSYHLLDGLYGLADNNQDLIVNLFEIGRYLEDKVSNETSPHSQFPMIVGSKNTAMARVDEAYLAQLKERRSRESPVLATVESKGFEDMILADLDSVWQKKYRQFTTAVAEGRLLDSSTDEPAAYDLFLELQNVVELKKLHGTMQRNLAAALQDDAQQAINAYLESNPTELAKRYKAETDYKRYPRYLRKAAEILGEQNFYYPYVLAKLYYFEGLQLRLDTDNKVENASYEKAIERQTKALEFQEYAPFVLNELGVLHARLKLSDKAVEYYEKAIELAPEWGLPYINYCIELYYSGQYEASIKMGEKAAERLADFPELYGFLAWINANNWQWRDKKNWERTGTDLQSNWSFELDEMSTVDQNKERFHKSIALLEKAIRIDSTYEAGLESLAFLFNFSGQSEKAVEYQLKLIELNPENDDYYDGLGRYYIRAGPSNYELSEQAFLKAIALDSTKSSQYNNLGVTYQSWGKWEKTIEVCTKANSIQPRWQSYANIAKAYSQLQNAKEAEKNRIKSLQIAYGHPQPNYNAGRVYKNLLNRPEEAEWMLLKAIEINPNYIKAINALIDLYEQRGQFSKAKEWQQKLLEKAPDDPSVLFEAGKLAYLVKGFEQAEAYFQKALRETTNKELAQKIGWKYHSHGEKGLAEKYYRKALEMNPDFHGPYWDLGWLYLTCGQPEKAVRALEEGIKRFPDEVDLKGIKAMITTLSENADQPGEDFKSLEHTYPGISRIGDCIELMRNNRYEEATLAYQAIQKDFSEWWIPRMLKVPYVRMLVARGAFDEAMDIIEKDYWIFNYPLLQKDPSFEALRKETAYKNYMRKEFPEKYDDLDTFAFAQEEAKYYPENCVLLANYYEEEREWERADFLYEKAIQVKPDTLTNEEAMSLAEAYLKLNHWEEAQKICPKAIASEDAEQNLAYGKLYYKLNQFEKAEIHFQKYLQLSQNPMKAQNIGFFYYLNSDIKPTEKYLKKALEINPDYFGPYVGFSLLHFAYHDYEKAFQWIDEGIQTFPDVVYLKSTRAFILAYSDTPAKGIKAFEALEPLQPGSTKIGACLKLMGAGDYKAAAEAREEIIEKFPPLLIPLLDIGYIKMLAAKKDFSSAMEVIEENDWTGMFAYGILQYDPALAPLRETVLFKKYIQRNYPGKLKR